MEKKVINQVRIDQSNMTSLSSSRTLFVKGERDAELAVNIVKINGTGKESYYNFKTKSFTLAFISENSLNIKMTGSAFQLPIIFPADATGDVYSIVAIAKQQTTQFLSGINVVRKNITQVGQTTVFLELDNGAAINSALTAKYTANPPDSTVSTTGSTVQSTSTSVPVNWTLANTLSDANGFGFMLPGRPTSNQFAIPDSYWYTAQVQICNGTTSSSTTLVLDSVNQLIVGMALSALSSGSISGSPTITAINGNTITLSVAQSIGNDVSITFRAYGPSLIKQVFGMDIVFSNFIATGTQLIKTVRTNTTFPASDGNVTLNLNGTYGVSGNNLINFTGFNVSADGDNNLIATVNPSSTAGSVIVEFIGSADGVVAAVVPVGTKIYMNGVHQEIKINGVITINKYSENNAKLALDLNKFITHGVATP